MVKQKQISSAIKKQKKHKANDGNHKAFRKRMINQDSIACVNSALFGIIETKVLPSFEKDIILDRFSKEILTKYRFSLRRPRKNKKENVKDEQKEEILNDDEEKRGINIIYKILKENIIVGTNECTRLLESAIKRLQAVQSRSMNKISLTDQPHVPDLILLARDVRPPTALAHIPPLAKMLNIPVLILPGQASYDLGSTMGVKTVSILMIMNKSVSANELSKDHESFRSVHECICRINSFVAFAKSKAPQ